MSVNWQAGLNGFSDGIVIAKKIFGGDFRYNGVA
jgi:hypothetical protein